MKLKEWFKDRTRWIKGNEFQYSNGDRNNDRKLAKDCINEVRGCCLIGAAFLVSEDYKEYSRICDKISNKINNNRSRFLLIDEYNDSPYTTFEDVKKLVNELDI